MTLKRGRVLTVSKISPGIIRADYAVRGEIALESERLKMQLEKNPSALPFKSILSCNIGNPHALNQPPISFYRKVISLIEAFDALGGASNAAKIIDLFGKEAYERVLFYFSQIKINVGAYSHSQGHLFIRKLVANFIERRDETQHPCDPNHIFLTNGASTAIHMILSLIIENEKVGVMIPEPQYPLYSATINLLRGNPIFYPIVEPKEKFGHWAFSIDVLRSSLQEARSKGIEVRALCIINPGNPTGVIHSIKELESIIEFCWQEKLVLLADEVYQTNIWDDNEEFCSTRKALFSPLLYKKNPAISQEVELFSFHSTSKGLLGECGKRGGYVECTNIDEKVLAQLYKLVSISLCSNIDGQLMVALMADPPSFDSEKNEAKKKEVELYLSEIEAIKGKFIFLTKGSLSRRAHRLSEVFNRMQGVVCARPQGALYLFPRFSFPKAFFKEAKESGIEPDTLYALKLLRTTGICVVNGSGFGQAPGTYHLRFTFLPQESVFDEFTTALENFHSRFLEDYGH